MRRLTLKNNPFGILASMGNKSLNLNHCTINYIEVNPSGVKTIFFIHGNSNSTRLWKNQLSDQSLMEYRLIALELPGHGGSSSSKTPIEDYNLKSTASVISDAIRIIAGNAPYVLCGFSLGSNVATEMLACNVSPLGLILISPSIVGKTISPDKLNDAAIVGEVLFTADASHELIEGYYDLALSSDFHNEKQDLMADYFRTDKNFRSALIQTATDGVFSDEIGLLNNSNLPTVIVIGEDDKVVVPNIYEGSDLFTSNVQIIKIKGGHYLPLENAQSVNRMIYEFMTSLSKIVSANPISN